jgi:hypothetical protein
MGKRIFSIQANKSAMTEFDPAMTGPIAASVVRHQGDDETRILGYFHEEILLCYAVCTSAVADGKQGQRYFKGFPLERC